ncbi:unnamed protein product, partial [Phaeothamnion confervicola]
MGTQDRGPPPDEGQECPICGMRFSNHIIRHHVNKCIERVERQGGSGVLEKRGAASSNEHDSNAAKPPAVRAKGKKRCLSLARRDKENASARAGLPAAAPPLNPLAASFAAPEAALERNNAAAA